MGLVGSLRNEISYLIKQVFGIHDAYWDQPVEKTTGNTTLRWSEGSCLELFLEHAAFGTAILMNFYISNKDAAISAMCVLQWISLLENSQNNQFSENRFWWQLEGDIIDETIFHSWFYQDPLGGVIDVVYRPKSHWTVKILSRVFSSYSSLSTPSLGFELMEWDSEIYWELKRAAIYFGILGSGFTWGRRLLCDQRYQQRGIKWWWLLGMDGQATILQCIEYMIMRHPRRREVGVLNAFGLGVPVHMHLVGGVE